ncbi:MAG: VanZ family protein [Actinobacteria bacterium]|jgi:VanZ like family.|nr:VanZ family protein [Actinomycetota bacterium]
MDDVSPTPELLRRLALLGLGLTVAAHFYVLYAPQPPGTPMFPHADKVLHVLVFAAPVAIALLLGLGSRLVPAVAAAHAPISETIQHFFLSQRAGDVWDVAADWVGVALGVLLVRALLALAGRRLAH